jgi:hypothetical protein
MESPLGCSVSRSIYLWSLGMLAWFAALDPSSTASIPSILVAPSRLSINGEYPEHVIYT